MLGVELLDAAEARVELAILLELGPKDLPQPHSAGQRKEQNVPRDQSWWGIENNKRGERDVGVVVLERFAPLTTACSSGIGRTAH